MVQFNIAESREAALQPIKANLATSGHIIFRYGLEGKAVPPEHQQGAEDLAKQYQPIRHFGNSDLPDQLGLTDYLANRLAILGTAEEVIGRIKTLESQGVNQLFFYTALADKQRLFNQLAEEILPAVR